MSEAQSLPPPPRALALRGLLHPSMLRFGLFAFGASFFLPATGFGVDLCPLHHLTGLPCPGCGMTRAVSMVSQGDVLTALGANPFVVFVWPLLFFMAALSLLPARARARVEVGADRAQGFLRRLERVVLFAFLGFGVLRLVYVAVTRETFP